jgi:uncharacterized membrane protein YgcG
MRLSVSSIASFTACFFLAAILSVPAWGADSKANTAVPGTVNYVEGQVSIGGQSLNAKSIGSAELQDGQVLSTEKGKAELLLTPGVFLRLGDNSSVEMISPSLTDTHLAVENGHAMVEVAEIHPENDIRITENGATAKLLKTGLYDFSRAQDEVRVFDGRAVVDDGAKQVTVKSGHEINLEDPHSAKSKSFDKKSYEEGDLYRWSSLRSGYLAEANVDAASMYAANSWGPYWGGPWGLGWWGPGWFWDPWFDAFTFMPGDGIFYSPFGWGFYSPWLVYQAPFYRGGWGAYQHYYHHFSTDYHNWGPGSHYVADNHYANGIYSGPGSTSRGFHSGSAMRSGPHGFSGGFHGGGGSHGGGGGFGGGGFHGR